MMDLLEVKPENYHQFTVTEMDKYHKEIMEYKDFYEKEKENLARVYEALEKRKQIFCSILEATGRDSYKSEAGNFSAYYRDSFRMEDKVKFYEWFRIKYGQDSLDALSSINYQSLNSFVKGLITENDESVTNIPGLLQTVDGPIISLRR